MHSLQFPEKAGVKGAFHYNSDFSGDILISFHRPDKGPHEHDEFSVPGDALKHLFLVMIEDGMQDAAEEVGQLILNKILKL